MIYVKFTDSDTVYPCTAIKRISSTLCALTFSSTAVQDTSGWEFSVNKSMVPVCGDYSAYTTVYDISDLKVTYSNDGSIKVVVTLSKMTASLSVGDTLTLTASCTSNVSISDTGVTWSSGDTSIATVSSDGVVTAVSAGTVMITATSNACSSMCSVCVVTIS